MKSESFQICIRILEARHLAWPGIDTRVCVQVDKSKQYTEVRERTDRPYYNEYCVFECDTSLPLLMEKIITLSVYQSHGFVFPKKMLGCVSLDVATVWNQPDHQFYHKWAVLLDRDCKKNDVRGFLKCDVTVIGEGETVKVHESDGNKDDDDIEGNLLVPEGVTSERQRARYVVRVYRADIITSRINTANPLSRSVDHIDPFVHISFAGLKGKTTEKKNTNAPIWNEELVFYDSYPPLWQRMRVQLRDSNRVSSSPIATHVLDLSTISSPDFLPTFGPAFINLYESVDTRTLCSALSPKSPEYEEEYRGRLLLAIETETLDSCATSSHIEPAMRRVIRQPATPLNEEDCWQMEEILLVGVVWDISMLEPKLKHKQVRVEISFGDMAHEGQQNFPEPAQDGISKQMNGETEPNIRSATMPRQSGTYDSASYCSVSYGSKKPCVFTSSRWPVARHRLYHSNLLAHLAHDLETAISRPPTWVSEVEMEELLRDVLSQLRIRCAEYLSITPKQIYQDDNSTKLDKMRTYFCRKVVEQTGNTCRKLEEELTKDKISTTKRQLQNILQQLTFLTQDPQHSLPDVFVWLVVKEERHAIHRVPARHLIFSTEPDKRGIHCGRLQSILMKAPVKKGSSSTEVLRAKLDIALWLGPSKYRHVCFESLPTGYEPIEGFGSHPNELAPIPAVIRYAERHGFECRAYIYQGWLKPGFDKTALCDSLVRIILGSQNKDTKVVSAKLDPTWNETLVFWDVILYGSREYIKLQPPTVMIEVLDQDMNKKELVGRATASPKVKLLEESYRPPHLERYGLFNGNEFAGEILASFYLLELSGDVSEIDMPEQKMKDPVTRVPPEITPKMVGCRIEVLFWGLRELKNPSLCSKMKPRVVMECAGVDLKSTAIQKIEENSNFENPVLRLDTMIPEERMYCPCMTFTVYKDLSCKDYFGTHIQPTVARFLVELETQEQWAAIMKPVILPRRRKNCSYTEMICDETSASMYEGEDIPLLAPKKKKWPVAKISALLKFRRISEREGTKNQMATAVKTRNVTGNAEIDWWTKYYTSKQGTADASEDLNSEFQDREEADGTSLRENSRGKINLKRRKPKIKIYPSELEAQPEFNGFEDVLQTFNIFRGKRTRDEIRDRKNIVGQLKGTAKVYRWPPPQGTVLVTENGLNVAKGGLLQDVPSNVPVKIAVRLYVVRAYGLGSQDLHGKSDPYLVVKLGSCTINDKDNYVAQQLDPTFGRCFELEAILPRDNTLTVCVMDFDIAGRDDIVGETNINLENRFYSKHRATCGLASTYEVDGCNRWRDILKPTQILQNLCEKCNISGPKYIGGHVVLGNCDEDELQELRDNTGESEDEALNTEELALYALRRWHKVCHGRHHLVPEHVETRSLFHPRRPGIEQGKLEMWVDMFPVGEVPLPPPVDITPIPPQEYELRVIIWNTEDVILQEDSFLVGEKMSDIFVKGWLLGDDTQKTDVHYRSLNGEGNFNWRFIFPFSYHAAEDKIVVAKKDTLFAGKLTEQKIPCRLQLQIWDNDFVRNDLLGFLTFDLAKMPRGAPSAHKCGLNIISKRSPRINLFKISHTKGWWPFQYVPTDGLAPKLTGKLEAEFMLLRKEEAERMPAGLGRGAPDALDSPKRPETSFLWIMNPLRSVKYIVYPHFKRFLITGFISIAIFICLYLLIHFIVKKVAG